MNPFCKDHNPPVLMVLRERNVDLGKDIETGKRRKGRAKFWECPRCKKRFRAGWEVIP